jgi:saccharopine dehydrogenase (NAD+, L-lysine-forming)
VQDAALAARSHFVDVTGEFGYMLATWRRDAEARSAGVVLLNAAGFDVVPSDLCAWLACRGLASPVRLEVVLDQRTARVTRGTALSILGILGSGGLRAEGGKWVEEPVGSHCLQVPLPSGLRRVFSVPLGDVVTAPRTTGAPDVRAYMTARPLAGRFVPWLAPLFGRAARGWPGRWAADWLERCPEGPTDAERAASRFTIWARATDVEGRSQFATLEGRDPYGLTAVVAAFLAARLAREGDGLAGALTPCQAADPLALRDLMLAHGVTVFAPEPFVGGW